MKSRIAEALVPDLDGVADRIIAIVAEHAPALGADGRDAAASAAACRVSRGSISKKASSFAASKANGRGTARG